MIINEHDDDIHKVSFYFVLINLYNFSLIEILILRCIFKKAIKYGIWTSTPKNNKILNNVYEECLAKNEDVYLFFKYILMFLH